MTRSIATCASCVRRTLQVAHSAGAVGSLRAFHSRPASTAAAAAGRLKPKAVSVTPSDAPRSIDLSKDDEDSTGRKNASERLERVVKMEMRHLTMDPWIIGEHVRKTLRRDAYDEALLLTQKVSRTVDATAAWNALIQYCGEKDRLPQAIKLYNDMKKRGQLPSAHTYTALFSACVHSSHPKQAVAEAMKLYNMLLRDSRLQPSTIHLNSALNVCAKAQDLDSMFMLADSINDKTRRADERTYTIILNAFINHIRFQLKDLSPEERKANAIKVVGQAKSLWTEVMDKWRKGEVRLDEEVVCAMCRVLFNSPSLKDRTVVFDVIQQTTGIPNLSKTTTAGESPDGENALVPDKNAVYVVPTQKTLGVLLTAAGFLRQTTAGIKYWNLLIRHYGVVPDQLNWSGLFLMLLNTKSSAHAVASLKLLPDKFVQPAIYGQVMKVCLLDSLNRNVIKNADEVLDSMLQRLPVPDVLAMRLYLRLALSNHKHYRTQARDGDVEGAKRAYGTQILTALGRIWPLYQKTSEYYFAGRKARNPREEAKLHNERREVIAVARQMSSAFNKVVSERMLPAEELDQIRPVNAQLSREIQHFYEQREESAKQLPKRRGLDREDDAAEDDAKMEAHYGNTFVWDTIKAASFAARRENGYDGEDAHRDQDQWGSSRRGGRSSTEYRARSFSGIGGRARSF